jgi:hypothetical protein
MDAQWQQGLCFRIRKQDIWCVCVGVSPRLISHLCVPSQVSVYVNERLICGLKIRTAGILCSRGGGRSIACALYFGNIMHYDCTMPHALYIYKHLVCIILYMQKIHFGIKIHTCTYV